MGSLNNSKEINALMAEYENLEYRLDDLKYSRFDDDGGGRDDSDIAAEGAFIEHQSEQIEERQKEIRLELAKLGIDLDASRQAISAAKAKTKEHPISPVAVIINLRKAADPRGKEAADLLEGVFKDKLEAATVEKHLGEDMIMYLLVTKPELGRLALSLNYPGVPLVPVNAQAGVKRI